MALSWEIIGGGIVTLIVTLITWKITKTKYSLRYSVTESDLFPVDDGLGKYYAIKISNNGNKEIKNISADITISDAKIDTVTNHSFINDLIQTESQVRFKISHLNPKDEISIVITTNEATQTSTSSIIVRGEGATASDKSNSTKKDSIALAIITLHIGAFLGYVAPDFLTSETSSKDSPDRIENIFSVLNKANLSNIFPHIVENNDNISYVGTAFYLTHSYLKDPNNKEKYLNALKGFSRVSNLSSSSKGVIYYLIYKINKKENHVIEANVYIEKCKSETPIMYKHLIEQDKYYNLDKLQDWLIKNNYQENQILQIKEK